MRAFDDGAVRRAGRRAGRRRWTVGRGRRGLRARAAILGALAGSALAAGRLSAQVCIGNPTAVGRIALSAERSTARRNVTSYYGGTVALNPGSPLGAQVEIGILEVGNYVYFDVPIGTSTLEGYDDRVRRYRVTLAYELPVRVLSACVVLGYERGSLELSSSRGGATVVGSRLPLGLAVGVDLRPPEWGALRLRAYAVPQYIRLRRTLAGGAFTEPYAVEAVRGARRSGRDRARVRSLVDDPDPEGTEPPVSDGGRSARRLGQRPESPGPLCSEWPRSAWRELVHEPYRARPPTSPSDGMRRMRLSTALAGFAAAALTAPTTAATQQADPADVATLDAIIAATYDVISGPAGEARDWDRFRSLFVEGARLIPTGRAGGAGPWRTRVITPDEYALGSGPVLEQNGFFEREIGRVAERYGNIVHLFSAYESRRSAGDPEPFARGINSFQLMNDGTRWWVVTIFWQAESPEFPIPGRYLRGG